MMLASKDYVPKRPPVAIKVVRASGEALTSGVQQYRIDEVMVPISKPAKAVVDCFKYRNKVGPDVAIEALKACIHNKRVSIDELWRYAKLCRVEKVMRPYLEAIA
jgi:predicted transcriptional regulator of viral defense system